MPLTLQVVTPEREVEVCDDATLVIAKGVEGDVGIMPGHAPLLIGLGIGQLVVQRANQRDVILLDGGFLQSKDDKVIVLAEYAVLPSELDPGQVAAEIAELKQRLQAEATNEELKRQLARAEAAQTMFRL